MKEKRSAVILIGVCIVSAVLLICIRRYQTTEVLEFGMFGESNWEVANADSYVITDKAIAKFNSKYPEVKVHYDSGISKDDYSEWLARKLLKGELPDVFVVPAGDFQKYVSVGALQSLENYMTQDEAFNRDAYYETALKSGNLQETQYALPYETVPMLMFVNKTLLLDNGLQVPERTWNWQELYEISKILTRDTNDDGRVDQFGTYSYDWQEAVYSNNGLLFNESGTKCSLNSQEFSESIKFVKRLNELNKDEKVTQEQFDEGRVAFMPLSFAEYRTYKTYPYKIKKYTNFQWDCITLPAGTFGNNTSKVDSMIIGINPKSKNKELAWEFLKTLTYDEEIQMDIFRYSQGASPLKTVTASEEAERIIKEDMEVNDTIIDVKLLSDVIENGVTINRFEKYEDAVTLIQGELSQVYESGEEVDSALKVAQRTVSNFLKK